MNLITVFITCNKKNVDIGLNDSSINFSNPVNMFTINYIKLMR